MTHYAVLGSMIGLAAALGALGLTQSLMAMPLSQVLVGVFFFLLLCVVEEIAGGPHE